MTSDPSEEPRGRAPHPSAPPTPRVVGVLGGIASGKSTVARLLAGRQGRVIDADRLAREELESEAVRALLLEHFGPDVLDPGGRPDREALARVVFSDPAARERLEGWIHPRVRERIRADLERARAEGVPLVVLDVPLLLENDPKHQLVRACDHLVFVEVPLAERDRRAVENRGWAPGEVARREAAQLPLTHKRDAAQHVLVADVPLEQLERDVRALLQDLERHPPRDRTRSD